MKVNRPKIKGIRGRPAEPSPEVAPAQNECDCHFYENQVCDICQGITGNETDGPIVPAEQPVECPGCHSPIFVRGNGTIVAHWDQHGDKCKRNESQYSPAVAPRETQPEPFARAIFEAFYADAKDDDAFEIFQAGWNAAITERGR